MDTTTIVTYPSGRLTALETAVRELYAFIVSELDPDPVRCADYLRDTQARVVVAEVCADLEATLFDATETIAR